MSRPKSDYADDAQNPANGSPMSLALRQLQQILGGSPFWIVIVGTVLLISLAGPYFTLERFTFPERLVYWGTTIVISAVLMTFLSILAYQITEARGGHWVVAATLAGVMGIVPVLGSVYLAEGLALGFAAGWSQEVRLLTLVLYVAPTVIAVTVMVNLVITLQYRDVDDATGAVDPPLPAPTLLQSKMPHHLGTDIVTVQAQDHYVEVTTPQGSAMLLMRLGDAVRDLEPLGCGVQVHRSWWVNLAHVTRTDKTPGGPELVMSSGQRIVVGRSFRAAYRDAVGRSG